MRREETQGRRTQARFTETRWALVLAAQGDDAALARAALGELCALYWPPAYATLRRRGLARPDAEDATQEFFAALLRREGFARVRPRGARFRSWLLAALERFLVDARRVGGARKRGRDHVHLPIEDVDELELALAAMAGPAEAPACPWERAWADTVVRQARARLRADYAERGRLALCERLEPALLGALPARALAAAGEGLALGPAAARQAVSRLRREFSACLRAEVARTVRDEADVDAEIRHLLAAWEGGGAA